MKDGQDEPTVMKEPDGAPAPGASGGRSLIKGVVGLAFVLIAGVVYFTFRDSLTLENFAAQEAALREWEKSNPILIYAAAFALYVIVTGLSLPGAAILSLVFAWYFGFPRALVLISFASTTGATVAFLTSRFVLRDFIQSRFGDRLASFNRALDAEGALYLFTLRLIPAVPFFVINAVMGLTKIRTRTFWWVSQVGMLPGTIAYVWAGASVPDLATLQEQGAASIISWQVLLAFGLLGLLPLALKKLVNWATKRDVDYADSSDDSVDPTTNA